MTWADVFPVLTDEQVEEFQKRATKKERRLLDGWFAVKRIINPSQARHVVSTSLFWKNIRSEQGEIVIKDRAMLMRPNKKGLKRFDPWGHYVSPLIRGAFLLGKQRPDVVFRVYLAADMEFLVSDLVAAGCEIYLMESSSLAHNPGAMWRFLAFEEQGRLVTLVDSDRAHRALDDVKRTEETAALGLGWWRVPVWGELNNVGNMNYRPILGCQLGAAEWLPMRLLAQAMIWHSLRGTLDHICKPPGCATAPVHGHQWPDYGYDEWFLQAAVYPRAAMDGLLTFVPADAKCRLLPIDLSFAKDMNPKSEMVHFGSASGGCCGPGQAATPAKPTKSKLSKPKELGPVLLTGIWQVKTANDAVLITELVNYAASLDLPVVLKPALHLRDQAAWTLLPESLRKTALIWEELNYNVSVQDFLMRAVMHGCEQEWIWQVDSDERVDFAVCGGLKKCLEKAEQAGADYVPGQWIDRIQPDGSLPPLSLDIPLAEQFPAAILATKYFQGSLDRKVALHRRDCLTGVGNHEPLEAGKRAADWSIPIWHFKWHSDCPENHAAKIAAYAQMPWIGEFKQALDRISVGPDGARVDWQKLPAEAWPAVPKAWRTGRYPVTLGKAAARLGK